MRGVGGGVRVGVSRRVGRKHRRKCGTGWWEEAKGKRVRCSVQMLIGTVDGVERTDGERKLWWRDLGLVFRYARLEVWECAKMLASG